MNDRETLERIYDLAHRGANGALDRAGRKATAGELKTLLRQIRDLADPRPPLVSPTAVR